MLKRVTSLLLCILMAASCAFLVACNDSDDNASNTSVVGDTDGFLPEKKDWGGEAVSILGYKDESRIYSQCQVDTEETNGEPVNDALFNRNELIKNNYGIDIELVVPDDGEDQLDMLQKDMQAGLNEIDAIVAGVHYLAPLAVTDQFIDFKGSDIKHLNLDKPWWDQNIQEDLDINGKCYFITGDALINDDEATYVMYYNKGLAEAYGLPNLYDIVNDGKWTVDKMFEMADTVANDQTKTWGADSDSVWGMITQAYDILSFMHGFEQPLIDNTGDLPFFRVSTTENQTVFKKIHEILNNESIVSITDKFASQFPASNGGIDWSALYGEETKIFAKGNALFMPNSLTLVNSTELRETEISFGIVPMPKYDENQDEYITSVNVYACAAFAVPMTNEGERLERTCYALEAMAYFGSTMVTEEFYTRTVSLKRLKDDRDSEMLDKIFDNKIYDMGCVFNLGDSGKSDGSLFFYSDILYSGEIASHWEKKSTQFDTGLQDFIGQAFNS